MIIDFKKLHGLIPVKGSITITIAHAGEEGLSVLMSTKHVLGKVDATYEKSLEDDKKAIEAATKGLSKVVAFKGSPEALTDSFEEKITETASVERSLADAIAERTAELNEKLKLLKSKKPGTAGTAAGKKDEQKKAGQGEQKEVKKPAPALPSLFGSEVEPGEKTSEPGSASKVEDKKEPVGEANESELEEAA